MSKSIILLTGNERKKKSFEKAVEAYAIAVKNLNPWIPEIQSSDNEEVAKYSAEFGAKLLGKPVIKMDSGFFIEGIGGFPGPLVKYVDNQIGAEMFFKILKDLRNRKAYIKNALAYCEPNQKPRVFVSVGKGTIVAKIRSAEGSFIDRLFIPSSSVNEKKLTLGEIRERL